MDPSGTADPLDTTFGNLAEFLAPYEPNRLVKVARHSYEIQANWKLVVENYHECYHCTSIHPELCQVTPPTSGRGHRPRRLVVRGDDGAEGSRQHHVAHRAVWRDQLPQPPCRAGARCALHGSVAESLDQPSSGLCDDASDGARSPRTGPTSNATGCSRRKPSNSRASTPAMPWSSGTSPTGRTGRPAPTSRRERPTGVSARARCLRGSPPITSSFTWWVRPIPVRSLGATMPVGRRCPVPALRSGRQM